MFAKSDMIHAQQKGYEPPEVLRGLCDAVMRNFKGTIAKGKVIEPPVAFIGGVAANEGAVRSLREAFGLDDGQLFIPEYHASMGAIGAALIEADVEAARERAILGLDVDSLPAAEFPTTEPLSMERVVLLRDMARPYEFEGDEVVDVYMGIDIGSVSTNLVVINDAGEVVKEIYTKTDARPVEVVTKGLADIRDEIGHRINLLGVGTTGSGRELIGELTGADIITDEITAHKTGADFIGRKIGKQCDTIFEIGGQDSKFISLQDGIVVDFAMNEACAAGTGSFLEEQAEKLGINIIGEFAELALGSDTPVRLGERCTVFMERDVMAYQQRGARRDDLVAGLAFSIATNYLNRLVRERHVGDVIFFQGGTAYNDAVAAAFSQILEKEVIVPPHNGVMGALGMALLARERVQRTGEPTSFRGWDLQQVDYTVLDFVCKACSNECDVRQFTIEGEKTYWGDKCSDRYRKPAKVDKEPVIADLVAYREEQLLAPYEAARARVPESAPTVGFARAMYTYDRLPFWSTFFAELGMRPVLSPESDKAIREAGVALTVAEPCFPIRVAHGHVQWLFNEGVDWVFVPNQVNEETEFMQYNSHACPWGQTLPFVVKHAPGLEAHRDKILDPRVRFRDGREGLIRDFAEMMQRLGAEQDAGAQRAGRRLQGAGRVPRQAAGGRRRGARAPRPRRRARRRPRRAPVQHVRQGHQHGHPAQAAQVLRGQRDPARLPAHPRHRHRPDRAQHVLELRAQDPADRDVRARPRQPAPDLHDQLQVRPRLVHQALRARGLGQAVSDPAVRRAPERRRRHDALRGVPGQQGLPSLVVAGRGRRGSRVSRGGGQWRRRVTTSRTRRSRRRSPTSGWRDASCTCRRCRTAAPTCSPPPSAPSASTRGRPPTRTSARSTSAVA